MSCENNNIIAPTVCCRTQATLTPSEQRYVEYSECTLPVMYDASRKMTIAGQYGNPLLARSYENLINDFNYLYVYLELIQLERDQDSLASPPCFRDKGSDFYYTENKIACIRKHFQCMDVDIEGALRAYSIMPGQTQNPAGIGFMSIEASTIDACTDDDQIFTVN